MTVQSVELEPAEWQQVVTALAMANPLIVKISSQLARQQEESDFKPRLDPDLDIRGGNSKESHP